MTYCSWSIIKYLLTIYLYTLMYIEIYFFAVDKRKITTLDQSYVSMGL